jgi:hypothetical protein
MFYHFNEMFFQYQKASLEIQLSTIQVINIE